jgi:hypothetical protein
MVGFLRGLEVDEVDPHRESWPLAGLDIRALVN